MSIGSTHTQNNTHAITSTLGSPSTPPKAEAAPSELARLTDTAGFATIAQKLQTLLEAIACPGINMLDTLVNNITLLQEGFVESLYPALHSSGVDLNVKITLRLGKAGTLESLGEHPNQQAIQNTLDAAPELSAVFGEIAAQSAALRDIHSLHKTVAHSIGAPWGNAQEVFARYQMSMKGDINHFYFA